jgi:serine/threonine protein kinase
VAVKIPIEGALAGGVPRERLRREALMLGRIDHPGVVARLDHGSQDGLDFLVMELVEGPTLAGRLRSGPLEEAAVLDLGARIEEVLDFIHQRGVIHCDLKPGNVVLTEDGVKLLDFGQARLLGELDPPGESFIEAAGTVSYMAPERFQGWTSDPRADLWSLGVLLYELSSGVRPFRGEDTGAVIRAILNEAPAPLSRRLDRFVLNLLEKDPNNRGSLRSPLDDIR